MGKIEVQTPELAVAAAVIGQLSGEIADAQSAVSSAQGAAGAFGDEPIAGAFAAMCGQATNALAEYDQTITSLSHNVAAASLGYVSTDEGVIPVKVLGKEGANP
jgi:Excreted virulence factor EspC, type VII ESX diderm